MSSHAASAGHIDHHHDATTTTGIPNKKLFMWAFLASDCMFFGSLIATHLIYRLHPPTGSPDPRDIFSIELTSASTFILLMSSLLMALAVNAIQKGNVVTTRKMLLGTIIFGLLFLAGQVYEFAHFVHKGGLTLSNSVFGSTFYTLTATHGKVLTPDNLRLLALEDTPEVQKVQFKPARKETYPVITVSVTFGDIHLEKIPAEGLRY